MAYQPHRFERLASLVKRYSLQEGANYTSLEGAGTFKLSSRQGRTPFVDPAAIWIVVQGRKLCHVGDQTFDYSPGHAAVLLYPMAVEYEIVEASPEVL